MIKATVELKDEWLDIDDVPRQVALKHLDSLTRSLRDTMVTGAPRAFGTLASSLDVVVDDKSAWIFYRWPKGMPYGIPIESGYKAAIPPPIKELTKWVELKRGLTGLEAERMAFAIARKKTKERTPARPWLYGSYDRAVQSFESKHLALIGAAIERELQ